MYLIILQIMSKKLSYSDDFPVIFQWCIERAGSYRRQPDCRFRLPLVLGARYHTRERIMQHWAAHTTVDLTVAVWALRLGTVWLHYVMGSTHNSFVIPLFKRKDGYDIVCDA